MKTNLSDVADIRNPSAATTINANNALVEDAIENTLSRDGTSPNQMEASLDMNSNKIINLPEATSNTEPLRKAEFDEFAATLAGLPEGTPLPLVVSSGGTGASTLTDHGVLIGSGTSAVTPITPGVNLSVLQGVTGADPSFTTNPNVVTLTTVSTGVAPGIQTTGTQHAGAGLINVRPNAGNSGFVTYTEDTVADRWAIGIKNADALLYFLSGSAAGTTRATLSSSALSATSFLPLTAGGGALGSTALPFSNLFLNSSAQVNWNNGAATIGYNSGSDRMLFSGATGAYFFDGEVSLATNDTGSLGRSGQAWSDLFLASGAVINFNAGNTTLTHAAGNLTLGSGGVNMVLAPGQIGFPATQNASADPNTLDDYEEGSWTPALTFATPGNLTVAYATQVGRYTKIGRQVTVNYHILTSTFTHTTASGACQITGVPFAAANVANSNHFGNTQFQGITKANYTQFTPRIQANTSFIDIVASGQGQNVSNANAADMPTAGTVSLAGTLTYWV